jgi:amino acid adenylation domain-containing protein
MSEFGTGLTKKKVDYFPFSGGSIRIVVPTTEAQREIFATIKLDQDSTLCFNETLSIEMKGELHISALDQAYQEILKRHDALRAIFSADGKSMLVKDYEYIGLGHLDLSLEGAGESRLKEFERDEVRFKFDLLNGPCVRAHLIKVAPGLHHLVLTAHHIICDGWSFAILLNELSVAYSAFAAKKTPQLATPAQFTDYALEEVDNGVNLEHKKFWVDQFRGKIPENKLPHDYPRPQFRTYNSQRIDVVVPREKVLRLKSFGAKSGASFYTVLMAVFQVLLNKVTKSEEQVVGMASAAQLPLGQTHLVGHLVSLLPLRSTVKTEQSFAQLTKDLRSKMLDAFDHSFLSFGTLLNELSIKRDPSQIPLVNVVFNIDQQSPGQGLAFEGIKARYHTVPRDFENFEIFMNVVSCGESLILECQYNTQLFDSSTIKNWLENYLELMTICVDQADVPLFSIKLPELIIPNPQLAQVKKETELERSPEMEQKVEKIWQDVLGMQGLSIDDNFFTLGGHSLLAVEVANRLQTINAEIQAKHIFEYPTIKGLASFLGKTKGHVAQVVSIPKHDLTVAPVSHAQMQVWYLEEMHPGTQMHNLPSCIRIKTAIQPKVLESALHLLIKRHAALRTAIVVEEGAPVQRVLDGELPQMRPTLPVIDITEAKLTQALNLDAEHVFDKTHPPLFKAKLYRLSENEYAFFFMVHHAIWDGWCFDIFFEEINLAYEALLNNKLPEFKRDPMVSYIDHTLWIEEGLKNGRLNSQREYWKTQLKAPLPVLELPTDFKRPLKATHVGATIPFTLSSEQFENVRAYARQQGTSLYNVFLTAFNITLARYSSQTDLVVGTPVRMRTTPEVEQTIGFFVNTVAIRSQLDLNANFAKNLAMIGQTTLRAFDHQEIPFQVVLNEINVTRDATRTPVFQSFFSYQDVSNRSAQFGGVSYTQINIDKSSTHTDLDLWIKANDKKIEGAFEFRVDLFKTITIERFKELFIELISHLNDGPLCQQNPLPVGQLELLNSWNKTEVSYKHLPTLGEWFEQIAQKSPNKIALETSEESLTYAELNRLSNRCASALVKRGVKVGDLVGISLPRTKNLMVALLGVLKSGAGYVPLDPGFPQERLNDMLESSTPKLLITDASLSARFEGIEEKVLFDSLVDAGDDSFQALSPGHHSTMYVIYTSGSTGKPKGVQLSHGSVINFLNSMTKSPGLKAHDKLLAVTTLSFDIAVLELYLPLIMGATVYLASSSEVMDGNKLKAILEIKKITFMQATPSTWRLLLASGWRGGKHCKILCGGEPFPKDLAHSLVPLVDSVWNMYGPTETTVWSTCKSLKLSDEVITIGSPIDNTTVYVLNDHFQPTPIGATGELFIGGEGLALGYFGRADLTAERFVDDPFRRGHKMYATGDYARWTSEGEIECLGRRDGQVKVRGYRIELGEIEVAITEKMNCSELAVVTRDYRPGDTRLVAFIVPLNGTLDERKLREALVSRLPHYMIPQHFISLPVLPKTLNGKIDRKALPEIKSHETEVIVETVKSDNLTLELSLIWSEVLGHKTILPTDNFFNLGGNSILAVQLLALITKKLKLTLPLAVLIDHPELKSFADHVRGLSRPEVGSTSTQTHELSQLLTSVVAISKRGNKNPLFCFHGVGGNVMNYMSLVPAMNQTRPLFGLQSRGVDGKGHFLKSIEEMAREYIKEMRVLQPQGPYLLAGGSMGGMIAYEVAQQLIAAGEQVEKLIMFDTFGPNVDIRSYDKTERDFVKDKIIGVKYRFKKMLTIARGMIATVLGRPQPIDVTLFKLEQVNYRALWNYCPKKIATDLYLIRAPIKAGGWYSDPQMGWGDVIGGKITTFEMEANHHDFIERPELLRILSRLV